MCDFYVISEVTWNKRYKDPSNVQTSWYPKLTVWIISYVSVTHSLQFPPQSGATQYHSFKCRFVYSFLPIFPFVVQLFCSTPKTGLKQKTSSAVLKKTPKHTKRNMQNHQLGSKPCTCILLYAHCNNKLSSINIKRAFMRVYICLHSHIIPN